MGMLDAGCSDEGAPGVVTRAVVGLTESDASAAIPECTGHVSFAGRDHLHYIGRRLDVYTCVPLRDDAPWVVAYDAETGERVDRRALKDADLDALRAGSRLHHTLLAMLDELGPDDMVDVVIWLRLDTRDLPDELEQIEDPDVGVAVRDEREQRMRASVLELVEELDRLEGTEHDANLDASQIGIPAFFARVPKRHLATVGELSGVNLVMPGSPDVEPELDGHPTETYFESDVAWAHHSLNYTGSDIKVAVYEWRPDSYWNLPGIAPGNCEAEGGTALCHCPAGPTTAHARHVTGVIRNSVTSFGGIAPDATTIFANIDLQSPTCTDHGLDTWASALNWATHQGATVVNISLGVNVERHWMFWDYKAATWPFPTVAGSAGNLKAEDPDDLPVSKSLRNGIVVGNANDHDLDYSVDTRHDVVMWPLSRWANIEGHGELPHIVAPGTYVATAGFEPSAVDWRIGTSYSAPQVSAAAACIQEQNPDLKMRPHVIISGLMVGADINADEATGGVWPLDLEAVNDEGALLDHRDGAGLMNMDATRLTLDADSKKSPTDPPSPVGHWPSGLMTAQQTPGGTCHVAKWNVLVPPGTTLRAHSMLMSDPNCDGQKVGTHSDPGCTGNPYPESSLILLDTSDTVVKSSARTDQNWQFLSIENTGSQDEEYKLQICITDWNGIESRIYAISWHASEPLADPTPP
jgi:hypothetical protein